MWTINCVENTVEISDACAKEINDFLNKEFVLPKEEDIYANNNKLHFLEDEMEHMDYLWREEIQEILCRHKTEGTIGFADFEGDNAGKMWAYYFTNGFMFPLKGTIYWSLKTDE